jgi:hypothetical protein
MYDLLKVIHGDHWIMVEVVAVTIHQQIVIFLDRLNQSAKLLFGCQKLLDLIQIF